MKFYHHIEPEALPDGSFRCRWCGAEVDVQMRSPYRCREPRPPRKPLGGAYWYIYITPNGPEVRAEGPQGQRREVRAEAEVRAELAALAEEAIWAQGGSVHDVGAKYVAPDTLLDAIAARLSRGELRAE